MKRWVSCPIPEDNFPWNSHYRAKTSEHRCKVCGLDLYDPKQVADAVFERYKQFLERFGEVDTSEILEAKDETRGISAYYRFFEVTGRTFLLIVQSPERDSNVWHYTIGLGIEYGNIIRILPLAGIDLGLAMQFTRL